MPSTPPQSTRDITSAMNGSGRSPSIASPSQMDSPDFSLMDANRTSLQRSRRLSDMSMLSTDLGNKYMSVKYSIVILGSLLTHCSRRDSTLLTEEDSNHVISSMQNSMWGGEYISATAGVAPYSSSSRYDATSGRRRRTITSVFPLFIII